MVRVVSCSSPASFFLMNVLHVNVRLQEGGAARIALDLHRQLPNYGIDSRFAYGWGENGGKSSAESGVPHSFQVGQQLQVVGNMVGHALFGTDCIPPLGKNRRRFIQAVQWADVIHLHAIHSYFLPLNWLVKVLIRAEKPVVCTAHDYWILTGRCASTEGCARWTNGCGHCPTQKNYPPSCFDFSAGQYRAKRHLLAELGQQLHIVTPSEFLARLVKESLPYANVSAIHNWIDSEFEAALRVITLSDMKLRLDKKKIRVLVIANDLSDPTKVDRELLQQLLLLPHIEIHTVGLNSPINGLGVVNHGRIALRKRMVDSIALCDVALFNSEKDTFGLVMIEALACGVPILAVNSFAAREVLGKLGIQPIADAKNIINLLASAELPACYAGLSRKILRDNVLANFGSNVGVLRYMESYKAALSWC